jgi:hypothetical protein
MSKHRRPQPQSPRTQARDKQEGAAMMIVMFVLLVSSASATFAVHSTSYEIRSSGQMRQAFQTQYVAETGLTASLALVDAVGANSLRYAMERSDDLHLTPFEVDLSSGKQGYRIYMTDFMTAPGSTSKPVEKDGRQAAFGTKNVYVPEFMVDLTDLLDCTGQVPGERADGLGKVQYFCATYTSRGRIKLGPNTGKVDGTGSTGGGTGGTTSPNSPGTGEFQDKVLPGDTRGYHEGAVDAQAHGVSGPFGR